jgi:uncharacterized SAM-binding protein YcdF (DUF218 family)
MKWRVVRNLVRWFVLACGMFFLLVLYLATTGVPWRWYGSMGQPGINAAKPPDVIVMMGGGGIPSESGLMRSWKTAEAARIFSNAVIMVAMPDDGSETATHGIEHELIMRGVAEDRLRREPKGRNTREQALEVHRMLVQPGGDEPVLGLVTSPEHMTRTWLSFKKAGFSHLTALPSWPEAIQLDLSYHENELGSTVTLGGRVGGSDMIKYKVWDNMGLMMRCTRETMAIWYYRLMGWL